MEHKTPQIGDVIADRYELVEKVGKGAFGSVFRARQLGIDRMVALKLLLPDAEAADATAVARFEREARLSSSLEHPNTVTIYDYGQWQGVLFLAMEYVRGRSLQQILRKEGAFDPERAVHITRQVLASLQEAHSRGIVHRDMKPGNIMLFDRVGQKDVVKVLDFGIAKFISNDGDSTRPEAVRQDLTVSGRIVGTPRYMSPEQVRGTGICPGSDIYSLGLIFYEMLTGQQAVTGDSTISLIAMQLSPELVVDTQHPKMPELLTPLIVKATAKEINERYSDAKAFLDDLDRLQSSFGSLNAIPPQIPELPVDVLMDDVPTPATMGGGSSGLWIGLAVAALLLLVGGGAALSFMNSDDPQQPAVADGAQDNKPAAQDSAAALQAKPAADAQAKPEAPAKQEVEVKEPPPQEDAQAHKGEEAADERPPEPPAPRLVEVLSEPLGATVIQGDQELGVTPLKVELAQGEPQELALRMRGYAESKLTLGEDSEPQLKVTLKRNNRVTNTKPTKPQGAKPQDTKPKEPKPKYKPF